MQVIKSNSSPATKPKTREPFGQVEQLFHVPVAFYEILTLATQGSPDALPKIADLMNGVINVTLADPLALVRIQSGEVATVAEFSGADNSVATQATA